MKRQFSENNLVWDYSTYGSWVGGHFLVSNSSNGIHGILKQWWDHYIEFQNPRVLLISENTKVKNEIQLAYNNWNIQTIDYYPEIQQGQPDFIMDICKDEIKNKYDTVINQATMEHLYNPFGAMKNLCEALNKNGYLFMHTHPQAFTYHQYPRDYFRFMNDWWYDLPNYIEGIKLIELYETDNSMHVFTCYQKIY